MQIGNS